MSTGDGFGADPEKLEARAAEFAVLAERAGAIARRLADELDATPAPWGGDAVGRGFAAHHTEAADGTRELLHDIAKAVADFGHGLTHAASAYTEADAVAEDTVRESDNVR